MAEINISRALKVGDEFFEPSTGREYKITIIKNYFFMWDIKYKDEWIKVLIPQPIEYILLEIKQQKLVPNTEAARLFYDKNQV